jgi:hypothetical protein
MCWKELIEQFMEGRFYVRSSTTGFDKLKDHVVEIYRIILRTCVPQCLLVKATPDTIQNPTEDIQ